MKLSIKAFALAAGLFWGLTLFVSTLVAVYSGYLSDHLNWLVGVYPWYQITTTGAIIGLAEGFIDGFFGGLVFAWLYNKFACCGSGCCDKPSVTSLSAPAHKVSRRKTSAKRKVASR